MRSCLALALTLLAGLAVPHAASAEQSKNVEHVAQIPEMAAAIALNFIDDTMFVSTAAGIFSYDVSDPTAPRLVGTLPMYIWENEDMDIDVQRKRLFISRDPRGFTTPATPGATFPFGAVHIIDVSNPALMTQVGFFTVPAGHTTTCVNACDTIWTGGPFANAQTQPDFVGRPIYATDVRDPANPVPCPAPLDLERNDGVTDYVHDVQVDAAGIAWVSGAGGVRGYWTSGRHTDPVTGTEREATGCDPIPYAGSGTPDSATPSRFMHNSWRDAAGGPAPETTAPTTTTKTVLVRVTRRICRTVTRGGKRRRTCRRVAVTRRSCRTVAKGGKRRRVCKRVAVKRRRTVTVTTPAPPGLTRADVLLGTEENVVSDCATAGRFVAYDLRGTYGGEGFKDIAKTKHRMKVLDTWTPEKQEGASGCASAHYFQSRGDGLTANAFYEQGVRFLDSSNPRDIRQVGFYREDDSNAWAAYWHKGFVFVPDFTRGVDILRFGGSVTSRTVRAPARVPSAVADGLEFGGGLFAGLCPIKIPAT